MRRFNVTGVCIPKKHYMVDINKKLEFVNVWTLCVQLFSK